MSPKSRVATLVALITFLVAAVVYFMTLTPTVPFWDSGEFIAVSYILGVPHPPGTPFFVLIGRLATLIPWHTVAERVNAVSAVSAALTVMLTYLSILRMARMAQGGERKPWHEWAAIAGAFCGALMLAFSDNFWENSIEAEVYQMMSLASILVFWLGLKWWDAHDRKPTVGPLLLATYVMWLSVGLHLGVGVMGAALIVLVAMVDWKVALLFSMPLLSILRVPAGMEKMAGAVLLLSIVTYLWFMMQKKLPGWVVGASAIGCGIGLYYANSDANFTTAAALVAALAVLGPLVYMAPKHREGRILLLALFLMIAGYSTHLYLPIRAGLHPGVNEGAPATWDKLRDLLERKQYGEMNMFVRRAPLTVQLDKEFWRYFNRQWPILPLSPDRAKSYPPLPWSSALPLMLGFAGGIWTAFKDRKASRTRSCSWGSTRPG